METTDTIKHVRDLMPLKKLSLAEAFGVAELQATKLLDELGVTAAPVDVARIGLLPKVDVQLQPRHSMPNLAGFSKWSNGKWLIVVNKNNVPGRRRFTLAHEFKHVLDHPAADVVYKHLGRGDKRRHDEQVELVCNYFAACLLMPKDWVKRAWLSGIRDEEALAGLFKVSLQAMHNRLIYLGYIGDDRRPLAEYFRVDIADASSLARAATGRVRVHRSWRSDKWLSRAKDERVTHR